MKTVGPWVSWLALLASNATPACGEEKGASVNTPQVATIIFTSGRQYSGRLEQLNATGVKMTIGTRATIPYIFQANKIVAVHTADDIYIYDRRKRLFESLNGPETKLAVERVEEVVATGLGRTAEEALKDAFRNAVRQVVGVMVDAETLVKNDDIIYDKVLTYSDGFVRTYKEIKRRQEKGLFRVTIKAEVQGSSLAARLRASKVTLKEVNGKELWGKVVTRRERAKNGRAMVERALELFPLDILEAKVIGDLKEIETNGARVTIEVAARVKANSAAYERFARKLVTILRGVAKKQGVFALNGCRIAPQSTCLTHRVALAPSLRSTASTGLRLQATKWSRNERDAGEGPLVIALNSCWSRSFSWTGWNYYIVDDSFRASLMKCAERKLALKMSLFDKQGKVIAVDRCGLQTTDQTGAVAHLSLIMPWLDRGSRSQDSASRAVSIFVLSPLFFYPFPTESIFYVPSLVGKRQFVLSVEDLKVVRGIKCQVVFDDN